jgi:hypothetical protein
MFILNTTEIPTTLPALASALEQSLRNWIQLPASSNVITSTGSLPALTDVTIDISKGQIEAVPFEPPAGSVVPGPTIQSFRVIGRPLLISSIPVQLDLTATKAAFAYARSPDQKLIATLQDAARGELHIDLLKADLNAAALKFARQFAGDKVEIKSVDVTLTSSSPTEVNVLLTVTAKKFVTAIVKVTGQFTIDNEMVATAKGLKATSDGMVGNIAVGILQPHLQKLEGQSIDLFDFSLGNVKLRGIQIQTTTGLQISAAFGSEPA